MCARCLGEVNEITFIKVPKAKKKKRVVPARVDDVKEKKISSAYTLELSPAYGVKNDNKVSSIVSVPILQNALQTSNISIIQNEGSIKHVTSEDILSLQAHFSQSKQLDLEPAMLLHYNETQNDTVTVSHPLLIFHASKNHVRSRKDSTNYLPQVVKRMMEWLQHQLTIHLMCPYILLFERGLYQSSQCQPSFDQNFYVALTTRVNDSDDYNIKTWWNYNRNSKTVMFIDEEEVSISITQSLLKHLRYYSTIL